MTSPPCSDKFVIARFLFCFAVGCAGGICELRRWSSQGRNIPFGWTDSESATGSASLGPVTPTTFAVALVVDRVERATGGAVFSGFFDFPCVMVVVGEGRTSVPHWSVRGSYVSLLVPRNFSFQFSPRSPDSLFDSNDRGNRYLSRVWTELCSQGFHEPHSTFS